MAENMLYCAGCNVRFKVKKYDPKRTYNCPKCDQPLKAEGEADTSADGVSLNTQGHIQTDKKKDPLVGRKIAQYKIVRKLGQGGMGSVYEAKHLELGRPVALKLLSPKLAEEDPDAVERFKREARAAAVLNHPNVVIVYSVGSEGPHHFIELEYVDGESLQERVRREKRLSVAEASRITMDAAKGLGAAHRQNFQQPPHGPRRGGGRRRGPRGGPGEGHGLRPGQGCDLLGSVDHERPDHGHAPLHESRAVRRRDT